MRRALVLLLLFAVVTPLASCGDSDGSGASELARQQELAAARRQAAEDARQSARIEELERKLNKAKRGDDSAPPDATTTTTTTVPTPPPANLGDWPGGTGYTAILASLSSEAEARATQREASDRGLDAGVLYSSNFNSLRPGYWVVFSGSFGDEGEAMARTGRARELGYTDAYPRFVAP